MTAKALKTLEDAIFRLKRDPAHPVRTQVDDLLIELRAILPATEGKSAAELFQAIGAWEGESTDEVLELLAEARREGTSRRVPDL